MKLHTRKRTQTTLGVALAASRGAELRAALAEAPPDLGRLYEEDLAADIDRYALGPD